MGNLLQDLRFTFRQLRKAPGFAITAILTLALGIGANTAVFSLVNAILLKPLPLPHAEQFTTLAPRQNNGPLQQAFSWPEYKAFRAQATKSFSNIIAFTISLDGLAVNGQQPQRTLTAYVSGNYFEGLGLKPVVGRFFLPSEGEIPGHDPYIVLSYDYWMQNFNGDPGVVGRPLTIDGHPMTVVGVAPKGFHGLQSFISMAAYLPLSQMTVNGTPADFMNNWQQRGFVVNGRLRPGVSISQADSELALAAQSLERQQPVIEKQLSIQAFPEPSLRINPGDPKTMYIIAALFLSLAVMVLLLACVNVANLVLVRATVREREMAIRAAMGARSARLIGQMITESVTLALIGGITGVFIGLWASSALSHIDPHADIPLLMSFDFDWRIFFYSFAIALLAGVVVGVVPAIRIARANVNTVLHEGGRGITGGRHWLRDGLVVLQIAASLVLLVVAGLFVRSLSAMQTMDFGFRPDGVVNFVIDANEIGMTNQQARDLAASIDFRLHQLAGVEYVSHASSVPLGYFNNGGDRLSIDGAAAPVHPSDTDADYNVISPEYFNVMGIDLLQGRAFTAADNEHSQDVAIISDSAAKKFWPNHDPIGRTFHTGTEKNRKLTVVGVAQDAEFQMFLGAKKRPYFYIPYAQHSRGFTLMVFQIRTQRDPLSLVPEVEKTIHSLAPQLPIFQVQTMRQGLYTFNGLLIFQLGATLAAIMGGLGLTLAIIGLYGVVSYAVSRRVHEIGLRMALGASRGQVFQMIYRQSIGIVALGLGIGLVLAMALSRGVATFVVVNVWDPITYLSVTSVLAFAALASCYLPAHRAMTVEPTVALRED